MEKHKLPYHGVSAKNGTNVQEFFSLIVDTININFEQIERKSSKIIGQENELDPPLTK